MEFTGARTCYEIFKSNKLFTKNFFNKGKVRSLWPKELNTLFVPREQSELGSTLFLYKTVEKVPCNLKIENVK